jgi:hypothetical protein
MFHIDSLIAQTRGFILGGAQRCGGPFRKFVQIHKPILKGAVRDATGGMTFSPTRGLTFFEMQLIIRCMEQQREKDGVDVAIDFFFGAIIGVLLGGIVYIVLRQWVQFTSGFALWIFLFAGLAISGSLTALFRNRVRKKPKRESLLAPVNERIASGTQILLWCIFVLGCISLAGLGLGRP